MQREKVLVLTDKFYRYQEEKRRLSSWEVGVDALTSLRPVLSVGQASLNLPDCCVYPRLFLPKLSLS